MRRDEACLDHDGGDGAPVSFFLVFKPLWIWPPVSFMFYVCLFCLINSAVKVNIKFFRQIVVQPGSLSLPRFRRKSVLEVNKRSSEFLHFNFLADVLNFKSLTKYFAS